MAASRMLSHFALAMAILALLLGLVALLSPGWSFETYSVPLPPIKGSTVAPGQQINLIGPWFRCDESKWLKNYAISNCTAQMTNQITGWLMSVEILMALALIGMVGGLWYIISHRREPINTVVVIPSVLLIISGCLNIIASIVYGAMTATRNGDSPLIKQYLTWGFVINLVSGTAAIISAILYICVKQNIEHDYERHRRHRHYARDPYGPPSDYESEPDRHRYPMDSRQHDDWSRKPSAGHNKPPRYNKGQGWDEYQRYDPPPNPQKPPNRY